MATDLPLTQEAPTLQERLRANGVMDHLDPKLMSLLTQWTSDMSKATYVGDEQHLRGTFSALDALDRLDEIDAQRKQREEGN